jgi:di/tricarboxylate transporter
MTVEIAIVLAFVVGAVVLFVTEKLPVDLAALLIMTALLLSGIITPEEGIAGFSNTATVTVAAMFVLSAGLFRSGAVNRVGTLLAGLAGRSYWLALAAMMLFVGAISSFINNTAAVAILLPIVMGVARDTKTSASRLLMPLSFASMFGGVCTLIGTSTNILVSSLLVRQGMPSLGMFEFTGMGLIFFAAGVLYMFFVGVRLIPDRGIEEDAEKMFGIGEYMTEIILQADSRSVGTALSESPLLRELELKNAEVFRHGEKLSGLPDQIILREGDHLKVQCDLENFRKLQQRRGIVLKHQFEQGLTGDSDRESVLVEAVVAPNSTLDGRSLKVARFRTRYGLTALAIRHRGRVMKDKVDTTTLKAGDVLLFEMRPKELEQLRSDRTFVIFSEVDIPVFRKTKSAIAVAIVAGVVAAAALGIVPIVTGAIAGSILMILSGCLSIEEAYEAVEWKVIFLMAGVVTLGAALEKTGAALYISHFIVATVGAWGPRAMVAALYLFSAILTAIMSNNATVALLIPIVLAVAKALGVEPRPFVMAVTYAASLDFMTPFGYQTNTLIYGPGRYRFADYLRVGTPLNILFWILATIMIPWFWPF